MAIQGQLPNVFLVMIGVSDGGMRGSVRIALVLGLALIYCFLRNLTY